MKVIVGISGSIAAYKSAHLVRLLIKQGHEVRVLMTEHATRFITPLTLSTLSKHEVLTDVVSEAGWNNHVELGLWADAYVIAPASANTLSKLAHGICDNILSAVYLSARCPVWVAPAMDVDMWHHKATQRNLELLRQDGVHVIPVGNGELASGLVGDGRMAEPEDICTVLTKQKPQNPVFSGKTVVITAGPTYEALDPVRFIGNRSTGKMGVALADAFARAGAEVHLILGPSQLTPTEHHVKTTRVQSAQEMYEATSALHAQADIVVFSAAVADYRPATVADQKIKKAGAGMEVQLVKTVDIAATLGQVKRADQLHIGFALETENERTYAKEKLEKKRFDFIILNSLRDAGAGFGHDTNKIALISRNGDVVDFPLQSKTALAAEIVQYLAQALNKDAT